MSALQREAIKQRIGGGLPPMPPSVSGSGKRPIVRKRDYSPVYWDKYFEKELDVKVKGNSFRVYECGTEGPVLFFLHGGGFSALSWAVLSSTLSHLVTCRCAAIDIRGHGDTVTTDDADLSAETLSRDVGDIVEELYGGDDPPQIILIGHSMGGAVAVHAAEQYLIPSLIGLVVIDVVEGTALEALSSMQNFLKGRPSTFKSIEQAIEWCVRSGQIRNLDSARVSMVGQVKRVETNETATMELEHEHELHIPICVPQNTNTIIEEEEEEVQESSIKRQKSVDSDSAGHTHPPQPTQSTDQNFKQPPSPNKSDSRVSYTWRINLSQTEKFWKGWFQGLSKRFLSCEVPKLLLLAGVDRLDKDLTIGQMQGKFQMQVLPQCGHAVHEDVPEKVADVLATFMVRHKVATPTANFHRTFPAC